VSGRVFTIGLDGASLTLIRRWAGEGRLPGLARILADGRAGTLHSTMPPFTATAWSTIITGTNPGRHGVFDFRIATEPGGPKSYANTRLIRQPKLWGLLSSAGRSVGFLNFPIGFPPEPVNGYLVSGFLTPRGTDNYTYPSSLGADLHEALGDYIIGVKLPKAGISHAEGVAFLRAMDRQTELRIAAYDYLEERFRPDLHFAVFMAMDQVQHLYWKHLDAQAEGRTEGPEEAELRDLMEKTFHRIDTFIAERHAGLGEDDTLLIVSDHGFGNLRRRFFLNRWLARHGWLKFHRTRVWGDRLRRQLGRPLPVDGDGGAEMIGGTLADRSGRYIDWTRTVAYASHPSEQAIYLNVAGRDPHGVLPESEYQRVREDIVTRLASATDPVTGTPLVRAVFPREEVLAGPYTPCAPDIYIDFGDLPVTLSANITPHPASVRSMPGADGGHRPDGLILAAGPRVAAGADLDAHVQDVAPTVLHLLGEPVPDHMDGRVLTELLSPEEVAQRPVRSVAGISGETGATDVAMSAEEEHDLEESLRALGYL
jgi:predicted AlkP superfamily phosphohydrolase/phosphomutase